MKSMKSMLLGIALFTAAFAASAQNEQFLPILSYRVGPYAAGGSGYYGGAIDYFTLINMTGGVNGVKLTWEECETEYNASKGVECYERLKKKNGGATTVEPLSTGIAYGLFDRVAQDKIPMTTFGYGLASSADGRIYDWVFPIGTTYWDQMAAMIAYLGQKVGGLDKLKGKKIAFLYHESAYGKEPIPVLDALAAKLGFEALKIPVAPPGTTQESQWLQIRQAKPDFVIVWTYGVMSTVRSRQLRRPAIRATSCSASGGPPPRRIWSRPATPPKATSAPRSPRRERDSLWCRTSRPRSMARRRAISRIPRGSATSCTCAACPTGSSSSRPFASRRRSTARAR